MKKIKKLLVYLLPSLAFIMSPFMFSAIATGKEVYTFTAYSEMFKDDFFTLSIFSWVMIFSFSEGKALSSKKYSFILTLCSFWMFISSIYHWLTFNDWTTTFVIISLVNIVAMAVFFSSFAISFYDKSFYNPTWNIISIVTLLISGVLFATFGYYIAMVNCVICILLEASLLIQYVMNKRNNERLIKEVFFNEQ